MTAEVTAADMSESMMARWFALIDRLRHTSRLRPLRRHALNRQIDALERDWDDTLKLEEAK